MSILRVPGAELYYETLGAGPALVVLQGGASGAEGSAALAPHLASHFTVYSYDRRGLYRSPITGDATPDLATHADDVKRLITEVIQEPAFVVGISIGARIGLELVATWPDVVRRLVAFEPPVPQLLDPGERAMAEADQAEVERLFRERGPGPAMIKFLELAAIDFDDRELDVQLPLSGPERMHNLRQFMTVDSPAVRRELDVTRLRRVASDIVVGAGTTNRGTWLHHGATALAHAIGLPAVEFAGGHSGYVLRPRAFAARLSELLS